MKPIRVRGWLLVVLLCVLAGGVAAQPAEIDALAYDLRWSPDGATLAVGTTDGAWFFDVSDPEQAPTQLFAGAFVNLVVYDPTRPQMALVPEFEDGAPQEVVILDSATGEEVRRAAVPMGDFESFMVPFELAYSPDGSTLAVLNTGVLHLLDVETGAARRRYANFMHPSDAVELWLTSVAFSADGAIFATDYGGLLFAFENLTSAPDIRDLELEVTVDRVRVIPETSTLLIQHFGTLFTYDIETEARTLLNDPEVEMVNSFDLSVDGRTVALGGDTGWSLLDLATGEITPGAEVSYQSAWTERIHGIAFSPDGTMLATLQTDGQVIVWDVATGEMIALVADFVAGANPRWG